MQRSQTFSVYMGDGNFVRSVSTGSKTIVVDAVPLKRQAATYGRDLACMYLRWVRKAGYSAWLVAA
jgi:hypothetical protein